MHTYITNYADIIDSGRKSTKKDVDEYTPTPSGDYVVVVDTTNDDETAGDVIVRTTVKSQKLNQWYQSSFTVRPATVISTTGRGNGLERSFMQMPGQYVGGTGKRSSM